MVGCIPLYLVEQPDTSNVRECRDYVHTAITTTRSEDNFIGTRSFPSPCNQLFQFAWINFVHDARVLDHRSNKLKPSKPYSLNEDTFLHAVAELENSRHQEWRQQDLRSFIPLR